MSRRRKVESDPLGCLAAVSRVDDHGGTADDVAREFNISHRTAQRYIQRGREVRDEVRRRIATGDWPPPIKGMSPDQVVRRIEQVLVWLERSGDTPARDLRRPRRELLGLLAHVAKWAHLGGMAATEVPQEVLKVVEITTKHDRRSPHHNEIEAFEVLLATIRILSLSTAERARKVLGRDWRPPAPPEEKTAL